MEGSTTILIVFSIFLVGLPLLFYLVGSIPFGLIFTRIATGEDIRKTGSGNIGATNVLRTGHKFLAILTLLFDFLKGAFLILIISYLTLNSGHEAVTSPFWQSKFSFATLTYGLFSIMGHCFPVWLKFKGGKGVATTFGVLFAAVPWTGFIAAVTWGIVAGFTRYSSLSALCAVAIAPIVTFIYYGAMPAIITVLIAALVIWRHKDNIKRLMDGTESKIGDKKNGSPA